MGTRHAKNQCTQAHYSQAERRADGYGSQTQRLGSESLLPFGTCCISLKPVVDPLVSKKGDLFSRDAIVEYLAHQKVVQRQEKAAFEAQEDGKAAAADAAKDQEVREELEAFEKQETGVAVGATVFAAKSDLTSYDKEHGTSADLGNRGAVSYNTVDGKIFVPETDQGVVQKRPNPWAHEATGEVRAISPHFPSFPSHSSRLPSTCVEFSSHSRWKRGDQTGNAKSSYREGAQVKVRRLDGLVSPQSILRFLVRFLVQYRPSQLCKPANTFAACIPCASTTA